MEWPGNQGLGIYAVALVVVFLLAVTSEMISYKLIHSESAAHTSRVGILYLLMLTVVPFDGTILLAACFGHALGFMFFRTAIFRKREEVISPRIDSGHDNFPMMSS
ncbi:hypothetical protein LUZ61_016435 [Rhynchospora tenuis]|uniref:Copper transporter n=1 Tax=Rhynchospora tenuis TaxID=198213 RepID=A0AAD6EK01_9POAL|nr:hypothetical protein LUZ61_016435 [Rhynchospora tenuis]